MRVYLLRDLAALRDCVLPLIDVSRERMAEPVPPITIWHNPRCSKSRAALQLLEGRGVTPEVCFYLESPPDAATIDRVLKMLGIAPRDLMRPSEEPYKALKLGDASKSREELIAAMAAHPILIERPVVIAGDRAVIGRPPDKVLELLDRED
jgi:arsenate reductase